MLIESNRKIIALIDKKTANSTIIHIYQCDNKITETKDHAEFDIKRTQVFAVSSRLNTASMFNDHDSGFLYFIFCNIPLTSHADTSCEYFIWKDDVIENTAIFKRLEEFPPFFSNQSETSSEAYHVPQKIMSLNEIMAIQSNVNNHMNTMHIMKFKFLF